MDDGRQPMDGNENKKRNHADHQQELRQLIGTLKIAALLLLLLLWQPQLMLSREFAPLCFPRESKLKSRPLVLVLVAGVGRPASRLLAVAVAPLGPVN